MKAKDSEGMQSQDLKSGVAMSMWQREVFMELILLTRKQIMEKDHLSLNLEIWNSERSSPAGKCSCVHLHVFVCAHTSVCVYMWYDYWPLSWYWPWLPFCLHSFCMTRASHITFQNLN
jgi:hypothetical protein